MIDQTIEETLELAFEANNRARRTGIELAKADAKARAALKSQEIALHAQNVYPVSLLRDIAKGSHSVSSLIEASDVARAIYESDREEVLLRKRQLTVLEEQAKRDWAEAGRNL